MFSPLEPFHCWNPSLTPGRGTKIQQALWHGQRKQEKWASHALLVGSTSWYSSLEGRVAVLSTVEMHMPFDPAGLLLGINPTHTLRRHTEDVDCTIVLIVEAWKQCKHAFLGDWLNNLKYFCKLK